MAEKLYSQLSFHFVKPGRLTEFLLRRYSSSPCCCLWTSSQKFNFPWQSTNEILFFDLEQVVIVTLRRVFETLSQRHSRSHWITEHWKRVHSRTQWWQLRSFPIPQKTKGLPDLRRKLLEKTVTCCLFLVFAVQVSILLWSSLTCCLFEQWTRYRTRGYQNSYPLHHFRTL